MRTSVLLLLALTGCGPVLKMRRLSPPKQVLGTARTVRVEVTPAGVDTLPGEATRVSDEAKRRFSERIAAAGYAVCTEPGCGDGVLQVVLDEVAINTNVMPHLPTFAMMDAAMNAVRGGGKSSASSTVTVTTPVEVLLKIRLTLVQADGQVGFRSRVNASTSTSSGKPGDVVRRMIDETTRGLGDALSRQTPLVEVPLEGGGPLNRGVELLHAADWAGAATYFTVLTRTRPDLDGAWYDLGFALEAQNAWRPALQAYEEAARRAKKPHYEGAVDALRRATFVPPK